MNRLSDRERRLLALAILALLLAAVWLLAVAPVLDGFAARRAERVELSADLLRDQRLVRAYPRLRAEALALRRDAAAYALQTADPAAARSAGEARLASAIAGAGGVLHAVRQQASAAGQIRLRADAALTLPALVRLLAALRSSRPYAAVEALDVAAVSEGAPGAPSAAGAPDASAARVTAPLEVRLDVIYAYAAPVR